MRTRIESRLSDIIGAKVEVGSSKVSLLDGTISFDEIVILPFDDQPVKEGVGSVAATRIKNAALRFSWKSLLYRNLKIDSFLANDVDWELADPSHETVPIAEFDVESLALNQSHEAAPNDLSIDPIVQPIKLKIVAEANKQSRSQLDISSRMKSVLERVSEAMPGVGSINVLRQRSVVEDARKELAMIKQLMAEDRISRKESDKTMAFMKLSAEQSLANALDQLPGFDPAKVHQAAIQQSKAAIAKEWNVNRSIILVLLRSLTAFGGKASEPYSLSNDIRSVDQDSESIELNQLPVGLTRLTAGKVTGSLQLPSHQAGVSETRCNFEMQLRNLSSGTSVDQKKPSVALKLNREGNATDSSWLTCIAEHIGVPQSDTSQVHFSLQRRVTESCSATTTIQHANQGWAATVTLPVVSCLELAGPKLVGSENLLMNSGACIVAKLIGTTPVTLNGHPQLLIDVDKSSVAEFEKVLATSYRMEIEKTRSQASIRYRELLNGEVLKIISRWEQLGDEHVRLHENWQTTLGELNKQLERLDEAFRRTSRSTSEIVR